MFYIYFIPMLFSFLETRIPTELIRNGNFEKGNRDFQTEYPVGSARPSAYMITKDLFDFHRRRDGNFGFFGDHTNGKGYMLVADGTDMADKVLWSQKVSVLPQNSYAFRMWVSSWSPSMPAVLVVSVNGKEVASIEAPSIVGEWKQLKFQWPSELDHSALIEIRDRNISGDGNDFVIDDISFKGPRPLPKELENRVVKYENEIIAIREKAEKDIADRKKSLIGDLQIAMEKLTKEGKLDEAISLRQLIIDIKADVDSEGAP
jgi:hypothetical protein